MCVQLSTCLVGRDVGSFDAASDHSVENRATYDRIASRYVENQRQLASSHVSSFSTLENAFHSRLPQGGIVVDVGCGPGTDASRLRRRGLRVVGVDLSAGMLDVASKELTGRFVQADMRFLPITSGALDGIWCVASLLHVPRADTISVLREFTRTLASAGTLALVTAVGESERFETVPYVPGERRWFVYRDQEVLRGQLLAAGFTILLEGEVRGNRRWLTYLAEAS
jgi:ubiquinone/menaquinone biosynthesis C-methylase UbiE